MGDTSVAIGLLLGIFGVLLVLRVSITFTLACASIVTALYLNIPFSQDIHAYTAITFRQF